MDTKNSQDYRTIEKPPVVVSSSSTEYLAPHATPKNADSVYYFTFALCELISQSTGTKDLCESLLSRVYDVLDDGYHEHVLKAETLQDLVNELGQLRYELPDAKSEDTQTELDSYMLAARQALGLPGLSRKQVDELIDRKAATRPIDIQVELEPITDDTSHLSLGSSPEAPILLKVPRFTNGKGSDKLR